MKIIFLDIDGVLNDRDFLDGEEPGAIITGHLVDAIDPARVELLNRIVEVTGASVVISSAWRTMLDQPSICAALEERGLRGCQVIGMTPKMRRVHHGNRARQEEIRAFLALMGDMVESFVILEDDWPMGALEHRTVRTRFEPPGGLQEHHVAQAIEILKRRRFT